MMDVELQFNVMEEIVTIWIPTLARELIVILEITHRAQVPDLRDVQILPTPLYQRLSVKKYQVDHVADQILQAIQM